MKAKTVLLTLLLILPFVFISCKTVDMVQQPVEEAVLQPEVIPEEKPEEEIIPAEEPQQENPEVIPEEPEQEEAPVWQAGEIGRYGNKIFECEGRFLEISEPLYEVQSFEAAGEYCLNLSTEEVSYRLPTIAELSAIYSQILEQELAELDYTYYWSCEEKEDGTVKILNFDTGFEGSFFKDMDFVSVIAVTEI